MLSTGSEGPCLYALFYASAFYADPVERGEFEMIGGLVEHEFNTAGVATIDPVRTRPLESLVDEGG